MLVFLYGGGFPHVHLLHYAFIPHRVKYRDEYAVGNFSPRNYPTPSHLFRISCYIALPSVGGRQVPTILVVNLSTRAREKYPMGKNPTSGCCLQYGDFLVFVKKYSVNKVQI